jgi:CheY-like chemotaxis protein
MIGFKNNSPSRFFDQGAHFSVSKPKLLLADDSLTIQKVVNLTFADEGIDVITVGDGDTALREIAQAPPDIVLADVHMPGPSGYEICSLMRGIEETANIPVMLLVGSFEQFDPAEADRVGANGYVTKPFQSIRQLVEQVKGLIAAEPVETNGVHADAEPEAAAVQEEVDTSDIDNLYQQSFVETVEMPPEMAAQMAAAAYASDQLDDSMIETSYAADRADGTVEFDVAGPSENDLHPATSEETYEQEPCGSGYHFPRSGNRRADERPTLLQMMNLGIGKHPRRRLLCTRRRPKSFVVGRTIRLRAPHKSLIWMARTFLNYRRLRLRWRRRPTPPADPAPTPEPAQAPQVVTLAPEQLDAIVQKVVEKLAEKL